MTTPTSTPQAAPSGRVTTRVLVVEDDPTVAEVVARYLRRDGHEVTVVGDGRLAVPRVSPPEVSGGTPTGFEGRALCHLVLASKTRRG
jgi:hypothetical protein